MLSASSAAELRERWALPGGNPLALCRAAAAAVGAARRECCQPRFPTLGPRRDTQATPSTGGAAARHSVRPCDVQLAGARHGGSRAAGAAGTPADPASRAPLAALESAHARRAGGARPARGTGARVACPQLRPGRTIVGRHRAVRRDLRVGDTAHARGRPAHRARGQSWVRAAAGAPAGAAAWWRRVWRWALRRASPSRSCCGASCSRLRRWTQARSRQRGCP